MKQAGSSAWRTYRIPAFLGIASIAGLTVALVGDGVFDMLSWIALGSVIGVIGWVLRR